MDGSARREYAIRGLSNQKKGLKMGKSIDKNGFIRINIIARNIEAAVEKWAQVLGTEKPEIKTMHLDGGENYTRRGEPVFSEILLWSFR